MKRSRTMSVIGATMLPLTLAACGIAPLTQSGAFTSYAHLKPSDGVFTRTRQRLDKDAILAARSARLEPTQIHPGALQAGLSAQQLRLVANAVDRAVCAGLSARLQIVGPSQSADLTVRIVVTHLGVTDVAAAATSKAVNVAGSVAGAATGVPIPLPRLPLGLGGLSVEASAVSERGDQLAALTWARGADMLTTKARISENGDAYELAKEFAADWSRMLVAGVDPIKEAMPFMTSTQAVSEFFGGKPKHRACEQFGRNPGVADTLGGAIGLPPAWTDAGVPGRTGD
jgi:hypothetical protein